MHLARLTAQYCRCKKLIHLSQTGQRVESCNSRSFSRSHIRAHIHCHPSPFSSIIEIMSFSNTRAALPLLFYSALFIGTLVGIAVTVARFGLFPFQFDSLEWCAAWLKATVVDFYGACLCLCGVILSSEQSWLTGILWVLGCCLLGSPVCCAWVLCRLLRGGGTLRLAKLDRSEITND